MRILHIENSPEICELYADLFGMQNHEVDSVNDGREGLELALKNNYDSIFLDMVMPKYGGMEFLRDLKEKKPSELRKVVIVSQLDFDDEQLDEISKFGINSIQKKASDLINLENTGQLQVNHWIS
ncbi:MAG: response regulator transcription factor [Candidatus Nitrosomaritimum yanchengensis]